MSDQPGGLLLELEASLPAPRERVFGLLTEVSGLVKWWGPEGFTTREADVDLRAGGRYRLTMQPPEGEPFHLAGEYLEVDPPRRLVYTFCWEEPAPDDRETVVALTLEPVGAGTRVALAHSGFATGERLELHRAGWTDSFRKLAEVVRPGA